MKTTGALLGTMSGSLGGVTASRNRGGQYFRQRVVPTNPASTRQNAVRAYLAAAVQAWRDTLTPVQRTAWTTYAANTPTTDTLGNPLVLTGQQAYIGAFVPRMQAAIAAPNVAPTIFNTGDPVAAMATTNNSVANSLGIDASALSVTFSLMNPATEDAQVMLYIGKPVNPTVNYFKGPYQLAAFAELTAPDDAVPFMTPFASVSIDEPLVAGQFRPIRVIVAYADNRTSASFSLIAPVVADAP